MPKNLILIENGSQVAFFDKYFDDQDFLIDYVVLAINPSAYAELTRTGIPFVKSNKFFKNRDHIAVSEKSHEIIELMRSHFILEDSLGVSHAYTAEFVHIFRHYYLHYWLSILIIIDNAVDSLEVTSIFVPPSTHPKNVQNRLTPSISLAGYICQLYGLGRQINVFVEGALDKSLELKSRSLNDSLRTLIFVIQISIYRLFSTGRNVIWATHSAYNLPRVADYLVRNIKKSFLVGGAGDSRLKSLLLFFSIKYFKFYRFPPPVSKGSMSLFLNAYDNAITRVNNAMSENPNVFSFLGVNMEESFMDYLENGLKSQIQDTFRGAKAFAQIIKARKPYFLIANQSSGFHYAIGEICKMENIRAMLISHGTHVAHSKVTAKREWDEHARYMIHSHFPLVAAQTPWTEKFLDSRSPALSTSIKTGPLLFSEADPNKNYKEIRESIFLENHNKKIILHAATPFSWTYFHPWIDLTHDEYIEQINDLIKVVDRMDDTFLAVRIRLKSFYGLSLKDIKSLFIDSDCYKIYTEGSFDDYLLSSDLLVSFSSTTIEEALQNKIPVLQYDPFNRYSHIPARHLQAGSLEELTPNSIYYVSSYEDLSSSMEWILGQHLTCEESKKLINWDDHIMKYDNWISNILG